LPVPAVRVRVVARRGLAVCLHLGASVALVRGRRSAAERLWGRALRLVDEPARWPCGDRLAANCLAGLSRASTLAGHYDEAEALSRRGLDQLGGHPGGRGRQLLISALHNQAGVALRLGGHLDEAAAAYEKALDSLRLAGRLRSPRAAAVYHNLGGLAFAQERHADAERLARHALRLSRQSLPPAPLRVAADVGMLGAIVAAAGRLEEGERLLRDALAVFERRLGPSRREIALALGNLAEIRRARGDDDALAQAQRALKIGEHTLGPGHPELAPILNTLSLAHRTLGNTKEATRLLALATAWLEPAVSTRHPALLACQANLRAVSASAAESSSPAQSSASATAPGKRSRSRTRF
jgi:tetratricopeptide (TPR) repeat protein